MHAIFQRALKVYGLPSNRGEPRPFPGHNKPSRFGQCKSSFRGYFVDEVLG
jgi:hypothetical protein